MKIPQNEPPPTAFVIRELVDLLGTKAVAVIAGANSTAEVEAWMIGELKPGHEQHLRYAWQAAKILLPEGPDIAAAWFDGENHHFKGNSPALALRDGPPDIGADVVLAAYAFVDTREVKASP